LLPAEEGVQLTSNMELEYQIEPWRNPEVLEAYAKTHYIDLPYHNWEHAVSVRNRSRELALVCITQGLEVDLDVIEASALWHDAGFYLRNEHYGLGSVSENWSKEHYSIYVSVIDLQKLGMPDEKIKKVADAIASTEAGVECTSLEGRILAQADIENVGGDIVVFLKNTLNLYKEAGILAIDGKVPPLFEYAKRSYSYLQLFLAKDLSLGAFDVDAESGRSLLCSRGMMNSSLLISPPKVLKRMFDYARKAA
jgi:hypothetical protein